MNKNLLVKNLIESTKQKNNELVKKSVESFLYNSASEKIKELKTQTAKTFFTSI